MKAALLLGAILLMSLVMADDKSKSETDNKSGSKTPASPSNTTPAAKSTGIVVSEGPVFFLLPLMWMVVHLLHI